MSVDLNGKRILVTGGLGFIGSNFIELVFKKYTDLHIVNYDKAGYGSRNIYCSGKGVTQILGHNSYTWVCGDLSYEDHRSTAIKNVLKNERFDYIFHFAAESHVDRSINSPTFFIENNVMGMTNLLEAIRLYQPLTRLVNVSSDEVYGHLGVDDEPFREDSPFAPRSPYAASKASADLIANSYVETFGLDIVTTHCCNNFGPHQADEKFIPTIIRHLVKNEKIPVYGDGTNIREWISVDDHNSSLLEIANYGVSGERYNIGSGLEKTNLELIRDIVYIYIHSDDSIVGEYFSNIVEFVDDRKGHDFRYAIDSNKYIRNFKLSDFNDSLLLTIHHYISKYQK